MANSYSAYLLSRLTEVLTSLPATTNDSEDVRVPPREWEGGGGHPQLGDVGDAPAPTSPYEYDTISITLSLPIWQDLPYPRGIGISNFRYCACHESRRMLFGCGVVRQIISGGTQRLQKVRHAMLSLKNHWLHIDPDATRLQPQAFLAFAFDPHDRMESAWDGIPNTLLEIPAVLLQQKDEVRAITFTTRLTAGKPDLSILNFWQQAATALLDCAYGQKSTIVASPPNIGGGVGESPTSPIAFARGTANKKCLAKHSGPGASRYSDTKIG